MKDKKDHFALFVDAIGIYLQLILLFVIILSQTGASNTTDFDGFHYDLYVYSNTDYTIRVDGI